MAGIDSPEAPRRAALEMEAGGDEEEEEKRAVLQDEELEDEDALFAAHDHEMQRLAQRKSRLRLLPMLCLVLIVLVVVAVVLAAVLPKHEESLEKCTPQPVTMPSVGDMTLAEKIGQMMQVDQLALNPRADVANYFIGSVLSGGGGAPRWGNEPKDWADMVDDLQAKAARTRLKIPIVYGADAVHGHNNVKGATVFPHHVGMGASRNPQLMQRVASIAAQEVVGTGVRWTFSPAVSVCQDPRWGRCFESFAATPSTVSLMAMPEILGFQILPDQWPSTTRQESGIFVAATAKHFVADGGTGGGKDRGDAEMAEAELRDMHLPPYITAITSGVMSIMVSYSSWNGVPMHENEYLLTNVLRQELSFEGVVISDWGAVQLLPGNFSVQVMKAINAGIDMVMVPTDYKAFASTLTELVEKGLVSQERIDSAVERILDMKKALGLFDNACARREFLDSIGNEHHRQAAREAVRETLVCLRNAQRSGEGRPIFPLNLDGRKILLVGRHANDIGLQCGGWTISWQGSEGRITTGSTILEGFREVVAKTTPSTQVAYQETYDGSEAADYGIVVVGEDPYAEYHGDSATLSLNDTNIDLIDKVCSHMPCIVVLVTGRSLNVEPILEKVDALIVAWLPGSEGAGIADVIIGEHDFKGRLPYSWFRTLDQLPFTSATQIDALFSEGFGLDKNANVVLGFP